MTIFFYKVESEVSKSDVPSGSELKMSVPDAATSKKKKSDVSDDTEIPDNIDKLDCLISKYRRKMVAHDSEIESIKGVR